MQTRYSPWFSVGSTVTRRTIVALWAVTVAIFDIAVVLPFAAHLHPGIDGWAALLLTDGTLGPIFAISLFQTLVLLAALAFPDLAAAQPVRVALTLSIMNSAALSLAAAISSSGASLVVLGLVACGAFVLLAIRTAAPRFALAAAIVVTGLLLSSIGVGSIIIGAGVAITGALTALYLLETRIEPIPTMDWATDNHGLHNTESTLS